ncbi:MAG: mechanosensitive ion channel family protein, partial [Shimia sp.]
MLQDGLPEPLIAVLARIDTAFAYLLRPWTAYQLAIVLAVFAIAWVLSRWATPRLRRWLSRREDWPMWRIKSALTVFKRLRMTIFVILIWATYWTMQELTWPSRSYIIGIIAQLALAWLLIAFVTRLIKNPSLRQFVRWGAWAYVTLSITGLLAESEQVLDSAAFTVGETRLSLLLLLQALVALTIFLISARFLSRVTSDRIRRNEDISASMQVLVIKLLQALLYGAALFFGLQAVGVDLTGLAFLSGAIGVGLGFGLQKVVSNLVSGVIILLDKSIKPGDVISLGETFGWINALGARYVSVVTRDGKEYLIPNEDLITNQVVNWSHSDDFV